MSTKAKRFHQDQDKCHMCGYESKADTFLNYGSISFCSNACVNEYAGVNDNEDYLDKFEPTEQDFKDLEDGLNE